MTLRLLGGVAVGFLVLDRVAALAGSTLGQAGLLVGALTVAATTLAERLLFPKPLAAVPASLGFGHMPQLEVPERIADAVNGFCREAVRLSA